MDQRQGWNRAQGRDHLLQARVDDSGLRGKTLPDDGAQGRGIERLGQVLMGRGDQGQLAQGDVARHEDANGGGRKGADLVKQFASRQAGHDLIGQHQVRRRGLDGFQGLLWILESDHLPLGIGRPQNQHRHLQHLGLIIHDIERSLHFQPMLRLTSRNRVVS
jgi:hypothetical protein